MIINYLRQFRTFMFENEIITKSINKQILCMSLVMTTQFSFLLCLRQYYIYFRKKSGIDFKNHSTLLNVLVIERIKKAIFLGNIIAGTVKNQKLI